MRVYDNIGIHVCEVEFEIINLTILMKIETTCSCR